MTKSNPKGNFRRRNAKFSKENSRDYPKDQKNRSESKMCANDPSWYIREGQLAKDVASISFNTAIGIPGSIDPDYASGQQGLIGRKTSVPGIMAIHTMATPGYSNSPVSPINIAAKNLYSFVRHANSGHSNYDSPDLIMYFLAMDSVYNVMYSIQRALGIAQLFSQKNRYVGDALIESMGILPGNLRENIAQYRARLNMNIVKASVFAIPNVFTLFKRHAWMYNNIFADSPVDKCQFYGYIPSIVHEYIETDGPGYLNPVPLYARASSNQLIAEPRTLSYVLTQLEGMLSKLQASEDINIMSGDILKAYGRENLFTLSLIPENYTIAPVYSEEILDQIHNSRFAGNQPRSGVVTPADLVLLSMESLKVKQDPSIGAGNVIFRPCFTNAMHLSYDAMIDMIDNEPTPERVLVATRNTIAGTSILVKDGDTPKGWLTTIDSCASDIPLFATVYYTAEDGLLSFFYVYAGSTLLPTGDNQKRLLAFHKFPILQNGAIDPVAGTFTLGVPFSEIENYTYVSEDTLDKMHQSAILSMLGVPV